ncbi:MAG: hypothetical protein ACU83P_03425 [Gammaproteobacteria bacterium]
MKKILYIDMDNVLVDFPSVFPKIATDKFQGEHLHFGTSKFPGWAAVLDYLMARASG